MPLLVRMHVYSGRPDPEWIISGENEQQLRRLAANASQKPRAKRTPDISSQFSREGLHGYQATPLRAYPNWSIFCFGRDTNTSRIASQPTSNKL